MKRKASSCDVIVNAATGEMAGMSTKDRRTIYDRLARNKNKKLAHIPEEIIKSRRNDQGQSIDDRLIEAILLRGLGESTFESMYKF